VQHGCFPEESSPDDAPPNLSASWYSIGDGGMVDLSPFHFVPPTALRAAVLMVFLPDGSKANERRNHEQ
jgi:hypothetical protein